MSKLSTVFAALALVAAGAASAQSATPLTREQVVADLVAAGCAVAVLARAPVPGVFSCRQVAR